METSQFLTKDPLHHQQRCHFSALNIFLSITATLGNALILIALHKVSSIYPPRKLFFRCLAVTDLEVGLIVSTTIVCNIPPISSNSGKQERCKYFKLDFLCCIPLDVGRNQCGQTSRPVVGTEIQTCRNIKASSCCYHLSWVNWYYPRIDLMVEKGYHFHVTVVELNQVSLVCGRLGTNT